MRNKLDLENNLKIFIQQLLIQDNSDSFCHKQFCFQCPANFPDTYVKSFSLGQFRNITKDPKQPVGTLMVEFAGPSIKEHLGSESLMLLAKIFEIYTGSTPPQNSTVRNRVLYQCQLLSKEKDLFFNIQLIKITDIISENKEPDTIYIPCLDTREDAKSPYTIRFFNFDYFENVNPVTGGQTSGKIYEDEKLISRDFALPCFMPEILIHSNDNPLRIDNLYTWLADEHNPIDDLKIWLFTHQPGMTFDPPPIKTEYLFLHGHNFKFEKWQLNGTPIETTLFSSSIDFLTKNKNNPEIQSILASVKLEFDEEKLETLLKKDMKERIAFFKQYMSKEDYEFDPEQINPKIIQEHINVYEYLLNDPSHAHQRDEIHRYIAYFRSRLSWPKKLTFWLTGDYFKIATPLFCALGLYIVHIIFQHLPAFEDTFPIYQIFNFSHLQNKSLCKTISITIVNIFRWAVEAAIGYCIFAACAAIKKRFGMGNSKDFFSSHSA